ncbi:MAG TPA: YeeE/YedE thiosulfate transporter family protein [Saprospiraceae bacterium]|nr:YeeE/YedE thiosulfate transporter family protein [Saprospiraceae bacterium]
MKGILIYLVGLMFGFVFIKAEVVSWYRIVEMFQFASFHMYGVIGTAVVVGVISVALIKKLKLKTLEGEDIQIEYRPMTKGNFIGGLMFGIGWAITGACPGPLFALLGGGYLPITIVLISAILGTLVYGLIKDKLPH